MQLYYWRSEMSTNTSVYKLLDVVHAVAMVIITQLLQNSWKVLL